MFRWITILAFLGVVVNVMADENKGESGDTKADGLHPRVKMVTTLGDIVLELDAEKAPITTLNFIQYAESAYYEGTIFHRVMENFMIQGGGFTVEMDKKADGLRPPIKNEWKNGLKNVRGSIAMARLGSRPDSATAQFFINVVDNPALDQARDGAAYAVFGKVVEGMETMDKIRNTEVAKHEKYGGGRQPVVPVETVIIKAVTLVGDFDRAKAEEAIKALENAEKDAQAKAQAESTKLLQDAIKKAEEDSSSKITTTASGLMYADLKVGEGASPSSTDEVEVHYTGWLLDGSKFDSSVDRGTPAKFPLNRVISGWTEGVGSMKVGGKRRLIIPANLAYGEQGRPGIPANSTLVFDVELLSIQQG